jgi:hypothetical protein
MRRIILGFWLAAVMSSGAAQAAQAVNSDLIRLHDDLHLTEAQEPAWRDYTNAIAPDPQTQARHQATEELLPMVPTPRRIALIQATMQQDDLAFRKQGAAVNAFYALLTPEQQKVFDRDTLPSEEDPRR